MKRDRERNTYMDRCHRVRKGFYRFNEDKKKEVGLCVCRYQSYVVPVCFFFFLSRRVILNVRANAYSRITVDRYQCIE